MVPVMFGELSVLSPDVAYVRNEKILTFVLFLSTGLRHCCDSHQRVESDTQIHLYRLTPQININHQKRSVLGILEY